MDAVNETIVAIATAPGRAAIGVVRLSGAQAKTIAEQICHHSLTPRHAHFSRFIDSRNITIDQGLVLYFSAPASYTGEDTVEFQAHGSMQVLKQLQDLCIDYGARMARAGEFTERAFLNGKLDLAQAEAVADLIDSLSEQSRISANESLQGAFSESIQALQQRLTDARVLAEGLLDFPEEETGQESAALAASLKPVLQQTQSLLEQAGRQALLRHGLSVAILGAPNVGKSSLLNCLLGKDAAIVTDIPGTTRDRLEHNMILDGFVLRFIDTAGIHQTEDPVEQAGIERSLTTSQEANIILWVQTAGRSDQAAVLNFPASSRQIKIINKIDIDNLPPRIQNEQDNPEVHLSAKTGAGISLLLTVLQEQLNDMYSSENVEQIKSRHVEAIKKVKQHIQQAGLLAEKQSADLELVADELRLAQRGLSEITGEYLPDDLLGEIFSRFCIGK